MAAFEGADRRLWCDLLSSDKYRNAENFKENLRKHKFASFLYNGKDDFSSFFFNGNEVKIYPHKSTLK